jgi:hypothetical protein
MKKNIECETFTVLNEIANLNFVEPCRNERYLHHYFTEKIQKCYPIVYEDITHSKLHPEWATAIKDRRCGGKYRKAGNKYILDDHGTTGYIDFAIGDSEKPEIGIEFKFCESWDSQAIVYDYMKLLDNKNSIQKAVSFSIIYREKELSNSLTTDKINETITELEDRLKNRIAGNRDFLFWIIEIAPHSKINQKRSWICDNLKEKFVER